MNSRRKVLSLILAGSCLLASAVGWAQPLQISVQDTVYQEIGSAFHGIQYHEGTYSVPAAVQKLKLLHLRPVRIWAKPEQFHPDSTHWDWASLDQRVGEVVSTGFEPVLCLYQSENWFIGTGKNPWWNYPEGLREWDRCAFRLAARYRQHVHRIILFDELNMLYPARDGYITFQQAAQLYVRAVEQIRRAAPEMQCGGPSSFGGWENGHWATYVLKEPGGKAALDFVSSNLFLSWDPRDSDDQIMARTIWYEEAPLKIRKMLGDQCPETLLLDAYNVSAVWTWNGQPWTDPRNTSWFGGIYQALALLHAAKGGFDIALHWETLGGYGVLRWYPDFEELPPYYAWRLIIEAAGLDSGAQILGCTTTEPPRQDVKHHGGMNVPCYYLQPFALRRGDGGISVILINKSTERKDSVRVATPEGMHFYRLYRFDAERIAECLEPLDSGNFEDTVKCSSPPYSVTVLRFSAEASSVLPAQTPQPKTASLLQCWPNPFRNGLRIRFWLGRAEFTRVELYDMRGRLVARLASARLQPGGHEVFWDASSAFRPLANGVYFVRLQAGKLQLTGKVLLLR